MLEFFVWCMIGLLGWLGISAAIERLIYQATRRPADDTSLRELVHHWEVHNSPRTTLVGDQFGWLDSHLIEAHGNGMALLHRCLGERLQMLRWSSLLPMVADVATAAGLLAAVISLYQTANAADHTSVIALGMRATIAGLMIAIPIKIFLGLFADRTDRMVNQADVVIEALQKLVYQRPPVALAVPVATAVSKPAKQPAAPTDERRPKQKKPQPPVEHRGETETSDDTSLDAPAERDQEKARSAETSTSAAPKSKHGKASGDFYQVMDS